MQTTRSNDIDSYIAVFPLETQELLKQLRAAIREAAPEAEEVISYKMPAYKLHGILVYFAGCNNHVGFYPTSTGTEAFKKELSGYKGGKGSVQFPKDKPIPVELVREIVKFRVKENLEKAKIKSKKHHGSIKGERSPEGS